jgi:DNA end-binding protein Ku
LPAPKARVFAPPTNVVNLMDALRASIAEAATAPKFKKTGKKSAVGQREMLLPISGSGKAQKKPAARAPATKRKTG